MSSSWGLYACVAILSLLTSAVRAQSVAPAPAPAIPLESDAAALAAYPISAREQMPLTDSQYLPVTCNITLIGLPASSTPAVAAAGRRLLQTADNATRGLQTADIHCAGSYNVTIMGGPALQAFVSGWSGERFASPFSLWVLQPGCVRDVLFRTAFVCRCMAAPASSEPLASSASQPLNASAHPSAFKPLSLASFGRRTLVRCQTEFVLLCRCQFQPGQLTASRFHQPARRQHPV